MSAVLRAGFAGRPVQSQTALLVVVAATVATVATGTAVVAAGTVAVVTAGTFATGSALGLGPAFGLGLKGAHLQTVFAGLLVDFDELDIDLVAFFET